VAFLATMALAAGILIVWLEERTRLLGWVHDVPGNQRQSSPTDRYQPKHAAGRRTRER
jgi:hypothetical protein